ncbi:MAG: YraN family protein [Gammaproteobacteria bacterium]|nr:YraN family protein [Gammaproteobacteria bacterium]MDH3373893.1 YraN family protein [Gammaproteobacteria bacterium]MDH3409861.1 YraN family protein [Gammaproteobacteria bacterium]MDH3553794.1 YraN family protein [Gammaproteobacteria bacterium]
MVRADARLVGSDAERLAHDFLQQKGLAFLARNFRCRLGEIDLIMRDGSCLVIVEVRYRTDNRFARARLSVDIHKRRKIIRTAAMFLARNAQYANNVVRFDIVAIDANRRDGTSIEWIRDAFRPEDANL